jgi:hypothetical protein
MQFSGPTPVPKRTRPRTVDRKGYPMLTAASLTVLALTPPRAPTPSVTDLEAWGREALARLREDLYLPGEGLYADSYQVGQGRSHPAFMWGCGVLHSALNGAAASDHELRPWVTEYAEAIGAYWNDSGPVPGFDVLPCPKPVDRYYDDNAWVVIALAATYGLTGDKEHLRLAEDTMAYVLSGEDEVLGGGIYWRESDKASKNTCSNAPAAVASYELYRATGDEKYGVAGDRILDWLMPRLQDPDDHLMWDKQKLDGSIERTKWSYNTALTLRALHLRAELRGGPRYDEEALAMADAAVARWFDSDTGAVRDGACFAHLLAEALLVVGGSEAYDGPVLRALAFLHSRVRDPEGRYPERWDTPTTEPLTRVRLTDQASAVRAYYVAARARSARQ